MFELLITHINIQCHLGTTALMFTTRTTQHCQNEGNMLKRLLQFENIDIHIKNQYGLSVLYFAFLERDFLGAQYLLEACANMNDIFKNWCPTIERAIESKKEDIRTCIGLFNPFKPRKSKKMESISVTPSISKLKNKKQFKENISLLKGSLNIIRKKKQQKL